MPLYQSTMSQLFLVKQNHTAQSTMSDSQSKDSYEPILFTELKNTEQSADSALSDSKTNDSYELIL